MQQPRSKLTSVWPASGSPFVATSNPSSVVCLNQFSNQGRYTHLFGEFECSKWTVAVANITYALSDDSIRLCIQINKFLGALDKISLAISPSSVTWHLDSVGFNQKDYLFFPINTERFFFIEVNENANVMKTYFDLILLASVFPSRIIMCSFSCVFVIQPSYQFYLAVPCVHSMLLSFSPPPLLHNPWCGRMVSIDSGHWKEGEEQQQQICSNISHVSFSIPASSWIFWIVHEISYMYKKNTWRMQIRSTMKLYIWIKCLKVYGT